MREARLTKALRGVESRGLDALLVTHMPNVFYLTGFTGSTGALLLTREAAHMLVDGRYVTQAKSECATAQVREFSGKSAVAAAAELANEVKVNALGFEADHLSVSQHKELRKTAAASIRVRSTRGIVERLRQVKDAEEIALIRRAAQITDAAFEAIVGGITPGLSEKEVALTLDSALRKLGADREAFDTIIASGANAACPHASPTDAPIRKGDLLKLDFGARYRCYNADLTRTICLGRADAKQREVHQIVLDAQTAAIEAIAPGKLAREIDAVARNHIASHGYGESFRHGLGHQIGIEVHDGPGFSTTTDLVIEPGMVFTVEPGIYIEGWGGVRIEDDVLVTESGAQVLTKAPKELACI